MEPDAAFRPPNHDEPPPRSVEPAKRPTLIVAVCSIWVFEITVVFMRFVRIRWSSIVEMPWPLRDLVHDAVLLAAVTGLWHMRKWAVVLFVIGIAIWALLAREYWDRYEWMLLPAITLIVSIRYFRQMRW